MPRSFALALFAPLVLSGLAAAQQIIVPSGSLKAGESIEVGFRDPGRANGTVTITIENGDSINPEKIDIEIKLDGRGNGETTIEVPNWWSMQFNGGGAKQVTRFIDEK